MPPMSANTLHSREFQLIIAHLDMDAFFTSVEQADNPDLRGKPVVIGQSLRGVASAASYEARKFGIRSAMPIVQAKRLCPHAIFLPGRMARYREVSDMIMEIMRAVCPVVEQASVDEAYADLSGTGRLLGPPEQIATQLKTKILARTGLTCSIGIAPNKFLAKVASDWNKPDGLTIIHPADVAAFLEHLPLARIPGVGARLQKELLCLGATTVPHILARPREFWINALGRRGALLHDRAQGIDSSPVVPECDPKSCSAEHTLDLDTVDRELLARWLLAQAERIGRKLRAIGKKGLTVTLKIKFDDFSSITRSKTLSRPTDTTAEIYHAARTLLALEKLPRPVRLVGTGVSNFRAMQAELPLAATPAHARGRELDQAMDRIKNKFGHTSIQRADAADRYHHEGSELLSLKNRISDEQ